MKKKHILSYLVQVTLVFVLLIVSDLLFKAYNPEYRALVWVWRDYSGFSGLVWLFVIVCAIVLIGNTFMKRSLIFLLFLAVLLQYCHFQYFGTYIQPVSFYQAFVNSDEVLLSFSDEAPVMIIPAIIVVLMIIGVVRVTAYRGVQSTAVGVSLLVLLSVAGVGRAHSILYDDSGMLLHHHAKELLPMPGELSVVNFVRSLKYFLVGILPRKVLSTSSSQFEPLAAPELMGKTLNRNVVLVIGETLRAESLSILGYEKNETTPLLGKVEGLHASSVYSAGTMTKTSVSALLNRLQHPGVTAQIATQRNCLFNMAKQSGFTTHFYSAQKGHHLNVLQSHICRQYIDRYSTRTSFSKGNPQADDFDMLLNQMLEGVDLNKGNHFIVLHQRGSHSPYRLQYPDAFAKFESSYDNSVLYTDTVLSKLMEYLEVSTDKETIFLFTSDHGELLGEGGRRGHGLFYEQVYKVPFHYKVINPQEAASYDVANIRSHFGVSNLVAGVLGFDTSVELQDEIYVNGSDIDALAGYLHVRLDEQGREVSAEEIRY